MKISDDEDGDEITKKDEEAPPQGEGLDTQWNQRMKERLEQMKSKKMRDMSITVTQKSGISAGALASRQRKTNTNSELSTVRQGRVREELVQLDEEFPTKNPADLPFRPTTCFNGESKTSAGESKTSVGAR